MQSAAHSAARCSVPPLNFYYTRKATACQHSFIPICAGTKAVGMVIFMKKLKIGVIGVGNMGRNHLRILNEESARFDLAGIFDTNMERAAALAEFFGTEAVPNATELLKRTEAVVIAVPSSLHKEYGLLAASQGVSALIEKPLATTLRDATELTQAFSEHSCRLSVGHVERFNPVIATLKNVLQNEDIIAIEARRYSPFDGRIKDASVIEDLMIHDVDIVCNLLDGHEITSVAGSGRIIKSGRLDFAQSLLQFDNGVQASVSASRVTADKVRELDIHTKDSFIKADLLAKTLLICTNTNMVIDEGKECSYKQDSLTQRIFVPIVEPLRAELVAFHQAVTEDRNIAVDGKLATHIISICEAIQEKCYHIENANARII